MRGAAGSPLPHPTSPPAAKGPLNFLSVEAHRASRGDAYADGADRSSSPGALTAHRDTATLSHAPNGGQKAGMMAAVSFLEIAALFL